MVEVDTGTETINALEGKLVLPEGVSVEEIYTGNSAILIWIARPTFNDEDNSIFFSGFSPGGFRGKYPVFSLGTNNLSGATFKDIVAFRNDGEGTEVTVKLSLVLGELAEDTTPPEPFTAVISKSDDIFEGKYFVSFVAQDKGTGVAKYEYQTRWLFSPGEKGWTTAESPKVLSRSELFKRIYIRATDQKGNYREVSTPGPYRFITLLIGVIIIVCILLFLRRFFPSRF